MMDGRSPGEEREMRASVLRRFGPPDELRLQDVAAPAPAAGEVLIDVEVANVTFVETQIRAGRPPNPAMLPTLPAILGNGVGGAVAALGEGTDARLLGRRVVSSLSGTGGYAELAVAQGARLIEVPSGLGVAEALAVLADGRTALLQMRAVGVRPGEVVAVEAAAGGVGTLLVQLAAAAGARVVALAGGEGKLAVARELGAHVAIDYRQPGWPEQVRSAVGELDVVFDGVGGQIGVAAFGLLRPGGRFCAFGMASGEFADLDPAVVAERGISVPRGAAPTQAELTELSRAALDAAAAGRMRPVIGQRHPLSDAASAHAAIEARATIGKTLLDA
jgi:NADPH2:quinone reductase